MKKENTVILMEEENVISIVSIGLFV